MNRTASYLAAAALSAAALAATLGATAARADEDRTPADGMTEQAISQIVTYAGYDVVDIDRDGGIYRVKAYEPAGARLEVRLQASDGSVLSLQEMDSIVRRSAARD